MGLYYANYDMHENLPEVAYSPDYDDDGYREGSFPCPPLSLCQGGKEGMRAEVGKIVGGGRNGG